MKLLNNIITSSLDWSFTNCSIVAGAIVFTGTGQATVDFCGVLPGFTPPRAQMVWTGTDLTECGVYIDVVYQNDSKEHIKLISHADNTTYYVSMDSMLNAVTCTLKVTGVNGTSVTLPTFLSESTLDTESDTGLTDAVMLDTDYYGVKITKLAGLEISRDDGKSEMVLNSDEFRMSVEDPDTGFMKDSLYFDPVTREFIFNGVLAAGVVNTPNLYAEKAYIAEITVDRLETSDKVAKYLASSTADVNYIRIDDQHLQFITAQTDGLATEHVRNRSYQLLYWTDDTFTVASEEVTDYPVTIYEYTEYVKATYNFLYDSQSGQYLPTMVLGTGTGVGDNSKGFIYKGQTGLYIKYITSTGGEHVIQLTDEGMNIASTPIISTMPALNSAGKRTARFTVGTSLAGWTLADCDYLCDGVADEVQINEAINDLPADGGEIVILDGNYIFTSPTDNVVINKRCVSITGNGNGTDINGAIIVDGAGRDCKISNLAIWGDSAYGYYSIVTHTLDTKIESNLTDGNGILVKYLTTSPTWACSGILIAHNHTCGGDIRIEGLINPDGSREWPECSMIANNYTDGGNIEVHTAFSIVIDGNGTCSGYITVTGDDCVITNNVTDGGDISLLGEYWPDKYMYGYDENNTVKGNSTSGGNIYVENNIGAVISENQGYDIEFFDVRNSLINNNMLNGYIGVYRGFGNSILGNVTHYADWDSYSEPPDWDEEYDWWGEIYLEDTRGNFVMHNHMSGPAEEAGVCVNNLIKDNFPDGYKEKRELWVDRVFGLDEWSNNGSQELPFKTIAWALTMAPETIITTDDPVHTGEINMVVVYSDVPYEEDIDLYEFKGNGSISVSVYPTNQTQEITGVFRRHSNSDSQLDITVQGFSFSAPTGSLIDIQKALPNRDSLTFTNCTFSNVTSAVLVDNASIRFDDCTFDNITQVMSSINSSDIVVYNPTFTLVDYIFNAVENSNISFHNVTSFSGVSNYIYDKEGIAGSVILLDTPEFTEYVFNKELLTEIEAVDIELTDYLLIGNDATETMQRVSVADIADIIRDEVAGIPQVAVTASRTLALTDTLKDLICNDTAEIVLTIPDDLTVEFPTNTTIVVVRYGTGDVSISPASGVALNSVMGYRKITERYAAVTLRKMGPDEWLLIGAIGV